MLTPKLVVGFARRKSIISMVCGTLLVLPLIILNGCTGEGAEAPVVSSLSSSTDATSESSSDPAATGEAADLSGEEDPKITMTSTSRGVTAHVSWDRPTEFNVARYTVYYGKRESKAPRSEELTSEEESSSGEPTPENAESSVCSSGESQTVADSPATITGLEPNTQYFFAIRAFNDSESVCSNEIMAITPSIDS